MPVFGDLIRKSSIARFTRTLGTLVSSGVPILDALAITARTAGNKVVERADPRDPRRASARATRSPSRSSQSKVFPPMVCQMIAVGETTGALDAMLQKIADFYEDEVDNAVANLTSLMEPLVILFLGVDHRRPGDLDVPADLQARLGSLGRAMAALTPAESASLTSPAPAELRSRLGWFLLVRLTIVSAFFVSAAVLYFTGPFSGPDPRLVADRRRLTASPRSRASSFPACAGCSLFAAVQIGVDLGLISRRPLADRRSSRARCRCSTTW